MPREVRPWYRPNIDRFYFAATFICGAGLWGSVVIMRHGYFQGLWLLVPSVLLFWHAIKGLWKERHPWIYETHKGREVKVRRHFRDEYDVHINNRCVRIYCEMLIDGVAVDFPLIHSWISSPMTWDERVDVLDILLEHFESHGIRVDLGNEDLPDTPQVRSTLKRNERDRSRRRST